MPWWVWVVGGVILLAAELVAIEAQFYLVLLGVAALLTGLGVAVGSAGAAVYGVGALRGAGGCADVWVAAAVVWTNGRVAAADV